MMNLRKLVSATVIASALSLGGITALATSASAAPNYCPAGYACAWGDKDYKTRGYTSAVIKFQAYIGSFEKHTFLSGHGGNDSTSSVFNNGRSYAVDWWQNAQFSGSLWGAGGSPRFNTPVNTGYSNLTVLSGWNDQISAANFISYFGKYYR